MMKGEIKKGKTATDGRSCKSGMHACWRQQMRQSRQDWREDSSHLRRKVHYLLMVRFLHVENVARRVWRPLSVHRRERRMQ